MEFYELFYKWVPLYVRLPVLTLLYLLLLTANGIYTGTTPEMASSLGVYTEPYSMSYYAMYVGMGIGSMTNLRIRERFTAKSLLLFGLITMLLMNIVCATTSNPYLTILACLLLGMGKVSASTEVYLVWLQVWSKKLDVSRLYPFVYFIALGGIYTMIWLDTKFAYIYNWRYAYIIILILLLTGIILTVIFVEKHPLKRKVPLFQMDLTGIGLLVGLLMLIDYVLVYGKVEDWGESKSIRLAAIAAFVLLLLFIKRELSFKRPVFPLDLFRLPNFRLGLLYMFLLGVFAPATIQVSFSASMLHYENYRNAELTLYLIPGVTAAALFCFYWFYQGYHLHLLMMIGFIIVICYEIIMYNSFGNAFEMRGFWLPSLIKGLGLGTLFIGIGIYITRGHTIKDVLTVAGIAFLFRSFLGPAVSTAIFNYFIYAQRVRHLSYLAGRIDAGAYTTNTDAYAVLQSQAGMAAAKELTGYIIIAGFFIVAALLISVIFDSIRSSNEKPANAGS
jgi:DHA2 family multidrug resistance protein